MAELLADVRFLQNTGLGPDGGGRLDQTLRFLAAYNTVLSTDAQLARGGEETPPPRDFRGFV
jgi:hypothetical protein